MLGNALVFDPSALAEVAKKTTAHPGVSDKGYVVTRTEKLDGSSTIVVKQPLQTDWSNSVGADLGPRAEEAPLTARFRRRAMIPLRDPPGPRSGIANIGSVDARIDPTNEQGKFGTTLKQSIPFGGRFAVTLQDTYSVTETRGQSNGRTERYPFDGFATRLHAPDAAGVRQ